MHSSTVVSYLEIEGQKYPSYGCGIERKHLQSFFNMGQAKKMKCCLDWLYGRCVYRDGRTAMEGETRGEDECKFLHQLPPMKPGKTVKQLRWKQKFDAMPKWKQEKELWKRRQEKRTEARKPKAQKTVYLTAPAWNTGRLRRSFASMASRDEQPITTEKTTISSSSESQAARTSVHGDDASSSGGSKADVEVPEVTSDPTLDDFEVVDLPRSEDSAQPAPNLTLRPTTAPKTTYQPQEFEEAAPVVLNPFDGRKAALDPQRLALNANAPVYNPPGGTSRSGSLAAKLMYGSVHVEPMCYVPAPRPLIRPTPTLAPVGYTMQSAARHPVAALTVLQEKNKKLTAEVAALKASHDRIHGHYQMEMMKFQNETVVLTQRHQRAMKRMVVEQQRLRLQYERQLATLRKQTDEALASASVHKQAARERAMRSQVDVTPLEEVVVPITERTL